MLAINAASAALDAVGHPVRRPDRRRAPGLQPGGHLDRPTRPTRRATEHLRARRRRPRARRRRRRHHDGRGRRHREGLALLRGRRPEGHRRGHRRRARGVQDVDQGVASTCSASWWPRPASTTHRRTRPVLDYGDDVVEQVERGRHRRCCRRPSPSPTRPSATRPPTRSPPSAIATLAGTARRPASSPVARRRSRRPSASLTKKLVRKRIVDEGVRIDGRGPTDLRPVSAEVGVMPTAHGSGLFQRGETQVLNVCTLAMPRMNQLLDTSRPTPRSATCTTTTWRRGPTARPAGSARRSAARSATACSPSGPCCPSCPARRSSPTRCGSCPRCCRRTARRRWRRCARRRCR